MRFLVLFFLLDAVTASKRDEIIVFGDFIPPPEFNGICMNIMKEIGEKSAELELTESVCQKYVAPKGGETEKHCKYFGEQLEQATLESVYKGPSDWCTKLLMAHSYSLKVDVLEYIPKGELKTACMDSISLAREQGGDGTGAAEAIGSNLPVACKEIVETLFRKNSCPPTIAQPTCKAMVAKANQALTTNELDPSDGGSSFCDGKSMEGVPFEESDKSPLPPGYPLSKSDWKPKITLAHLRELIRHAFKTPMDAFNKFDKDKDGKLSRDEWAKLMKALGVPRLDGDLLGHQMDANKDKGISLKEYDEAIGANLDDIVQYSNDKHQNAINGLKAADANGDGAVDPQEFEKFCKELGVSPMNAKQIFPEVDADGDGIITGEEFMNAFGVDVPELKRRARRKMGSPDSSFEKFDANGDGNIDEAEFAAGCEKLHIPPAQAKKLMKEMDGSGDGLIDPEEWKAAMGMDKEDLKKEVLGNMGGADAAVKAMDADGDGVVSPEELTKGLEKAGASPEEAAELAKAMDKDGDGKVSPDELHAGAGGDEMDKAKGIERPTGPGVTVPEFKERCKAKFGTPKEAFDAMDTNPKDGKLSCAELAAGGKTLTPAVSAEDANELCKAIDKNGDEGITPEEFFDVMGGGPSGEKFEVPLPDYMERVKAKHGTPKKGFEACDVDKDGKLTPKEFELCAKKLKPPLSPEEAAGVFKKLDTKPKDGGISPEEYFGAMGGPEKFGLTVPEFKDRAGEKFGDPQKAFDGFDIKPKDGKISPEEFEAGCAQLMPPVSPEECGPLFKQLDKSKDGFITPEEFFKAVGKDKFAPDGDVAAKEASKALPTSPEERVAQMDKDGDGKVSPEEAKAAMDTDGDGKISPEEEVAALDKDGDGKVSPEEMTEAAKAGNIPPEKMKEMDKDGDGVVSPEEMEQAAAKTDPKEKMKEAMKKGFSSPKEAMKGMDKDGDGKISPQEMKEGLEAKGVSPEEADKMVKAADKDGDGKVSEEELYGAVGSPDEFAKAGPGKKAEEAEVSDEEMKERMGQAFKDGKDAWDKIAGPNAKTMTREQFQKKCKDLGVGPGECDKHYNKMDKDGDGVVGQDEFQNSVGVDEDEAQDRILDKYGNADEALKAADANGDGEVTQEELEKVMQESGLTKENAKKAAKEMMKKMDPDGDGKVSGEEFKDATKAKADDLADRIEEKMGSANEAMKKWDKDGDGQLTKEEFMKGAKEMGISDEAAADMWKKQDKDGDGKMNAEDFAKSFGLGPDEVMERCFQYYGNVQKAFDEMDKNHDGLLSPTEWAGGAAKMRLKADQEERIFKEMDTNHKERTHLHISRWEFYKYLDYEEPNFKSTGDGFGDIDPWGTDHKKFNELPHLKAGRKSRVDRPDQAVATFDKGPHRGWSDKDYMYDDQNLPKHVDKDDFYHHGDVNEAPMHAAFLQRPIGAHFH